MKRSSGKTDSSVKAGLELAAGTNPKKADKNNMHIPEGDTEKDVDEEVHDRRNEMPDASIEEDMDDLVHQKDINTDSEYDEELDIDDLVHDSNNMTSKHDYI